MFPMCSVGGRVRLRLIVLLLIKQLLLAVRIPRVWRPHPYLSPLIVCALALPGLALAQSIQEFLIPSGRPATAIVSGLDGALWFTEPSGDRIGRIGVDGRITEFPVPSGSSPYFLALGSDGAFWFPELPYSIGRLTTEGSLTHYDVGPYHPRAIAAGADGALWFTTYYAFSIGRITTAGVVSQFPTPPTPLSLHLIAPGPDGALWYTMFQRGQIGRMTTSGQAQVFNFGQLDFITSLTAGPDAAIWFTHSSSLLSRVTSSGTFNDFPLPMTDLSGLPGPLTVSRDGNLLIAIPDKILVVSLTGVVKDQIALPAGVRIAEMTIGPDGALWFTEAETPRIGRFGGGGSAQAVPILSPAAVAAFAVALAVASLILLRRS